VASAVSTVPSAHAPVQQNKKDQTEGKKGWDEPELLEIVQFVKFF